MNKPTEALAKGAVIAALGLAILTYALVAMWHATPW